MTGRKLINVNGSVIELPSEHAGDAVQNGPWFTIDTRGHLVEGTACICKAAPAAVGRPGSPEVALAVRVNVSQQNLDR